MKTLTIVGARPQFIKAAAISRTILEDARVDEVILHTGQHFDVGMSKVFFEQLKIPKPTYQLDINGGTHGEMTGRMLQAIDEALAHVHPDVVLVYGDTNSTLAGALSAAKLHVPVAHVEPGLRSFNMRMPEEINRILTDRLSSLLLCPTDQAVQNLMREGYNSFEAKIVQCGDVMFDCVKLFRDFAAKPSTEVPSRFVLSTLHRAENTDSEERLAGIINGLNKVHRTLLPVVMPLHPRTKHRVGELKLDVQFRTIDPVGYLEMLWLLEHCDAVCTDSGGLQKEAYFFAKQCITLREETEWIELVESKVNRLCPSRAQTVAEVIGRTLELPFDARHDIYGDGMSAKKIVDHLVQCFGHS